MILVGSHPSIDDSSLERDTSGTVTRGRFSLSGYTFTWSRLGTGGMLVVSLPGKPLPLHIPAQSWDKALGQAPSCAALLASGRLPLAGVFRPAIEPMKKGPISRLFYLFKGKREGKPTMFLTNDDGNVFPVFDGDKYTPRDSSRHREIVQKIHDNTTDPKKKAKHAEYLKGLDDASGRMEPQKIAIAMDGVSVKDLAELIRRGVALPKHATGEWTVYKRADGLVHMERDGKFLNVPEAHYAALEDAGALRATGGKDAPAETAQKPPQGTKHPWEMSSREWEDARRGSSSRPELWNAKIPSGPGFTAMANRETKRVEEKVRLGHDVQGWRRQKVEAKEGTYADREDFLADLHGAIHDPVTHREVVEKALEEGREVPSHVRAEHPQIASRPMAVPSDFFVDATQEASGIDARRFTISDKNRIELAFDKAEYDGLPDNLRNDIRRFYNWSPSRKAWVSRGAADNHTALQIAKRAGFDGPEAAFKPAASVAHTPADVPGIPDGKLHRATHGDIPFQLAHDAHRGTSHTPEIRAKQEREDYVSHMDGVAAHFGPMADTPEKQAILKEELERYRQGFLEKNAAYLQAKSRVMSSMVTGPARFPTDRNRKRSDAADARREELNDWSRKAQSSIAKKVSGEGPIMSYEPSAVQNLRKELATREKAHGIMVAVNKIVKDKKLLTEQKVERLMKEHAVKEETARNYLKGDIMGNVGFPDYALKNSSANIRRLRDRLESVAKLHGVDPMEKGPGSRVPTPEMAAAARRGMELSQGGKRGMLSRMEARKQGIHSGLEMANALADRRELSEEEIRRGHRFWIRHAKNFSVDAGKEPHEDRGYIAGLGWGGRTAAAWFRARYEALEREKMEKGPSIFTGLGNVFDSYLRKAPVAAPALSPVVRVGPPPARNRKEYPFVGTIAYQGIPIAVENRKGDTRSGTDRDGKPWRVTMGGHYGEIVNGGTDNTREKRDVYVLDKGDASEAHIIGQLHPDSGEFDEEKIILGASSQDEAVRFYKGQYDRPGFFGGCCTLSLGELKRRLRDPARRGKRLTEEPEVMRKGPCFILLKGSRAERQPDYFLTNKATGSVFPVFGDRYTPRDEKKHRQIARKVAQESGSAPIQASSAALPSAESHRAPVAWPKWNDDEEDDESNWHPSMRADSSHASGDDLDDYAERMLSRWEDEQEDSSRDWEREQMEDLEAQTRKASPLSLVSKRGGLRLSTGIEAELVHAAGGRKYVMPGLLRAEGRGGISLKEAAEILADEGHDVLDEHDRPDEGRALEALVAATRKWSLSKGPNEEAPSMVQRFFLLFKGKKKGEPTGFLTSEDGNVFPVFSGDPYKPRDEKKSHEIQDRIAAQTTGAKGGDYKKHIAGVADRAHHLAKYMDREQFQHHVLMRAGHEHDDGSAKADEIRGHADRVWSEHAARKKPQEPDQASGRRLSIVREPARPARLNAHEVSPEAYAAQVPEGHEAHAEHWDAVRGDAVLRARSRAYHDAANDPYEREGMKAVKQRNAKADVEKRLEQMGLSKELAPMALAIGAQEREHEAGVRDAVKRGLDVKKESYEGYPDLAVKRGLSDSFRGHVAGGPSDAEVSAAKDRESAMRQEAAYSAALRGQQQASAPLLGDRPPRDPETLPKSMLKERASGLSGWKDARGHYGSKELRHGDYGIRELTDGKFVAFAADMPSRNPEVDESIHLSKRHDSAKDALEELKGRVGVDRGAKEREKAAADEQRQWRKKYHLEHPGEMPRPDKELVGMANDAEYEGDAVTMMRKEAIRYGTSPAGFIEHHVGADRARELAQKYPKAFEPSDAEKEMEHKHPLHSPSGSVWAQHAKDADTARRKERLAMPSKAPYPASATIHTARDHGDPDQRYALEDMRKEAIRAGTSPAGYIEHHLGTDDAETAARTFPHAFAPSEEEATHGHTHRLHNPPAFSQDMEAELKAYASHPAEKFGKAVSGSLSRSGAINEKNVESLKGLVPDSHVEAARGALKLQDEQRQQAAKDGLRRILERHPAGYPKLPPEHVEQRAKDHYFNDSDTSQQWRHHGGYEGYAKAVRSEYERTQP